MLARRCTNQRAGSARGVPAGGSPGAEAHQMPDQPPPAAIGSVRFEAKTLLLVAHVIEQAAILAVGQARRPIGQDARPGDMPAEYLPLFGTEVLLQKLH